MNISKSVMYIIFTLVLLVSCNKGQNENNEPFKQETPKALQEDKFAGKSYSRPGNLTDELYQELVNQNPALKKLEDDLEAFESKPYELNEKFKKYDIKSNSYYSSVNQKASTIEDSLLKKKIVDLILNSNNKYRVNTSELHSLLNVISKNGSTLNDHHSVLKIVLTLPIIEKYQDENKPIKKEFEDLIEQQEKLIFRIDSLTPEF